MRGEGVQEPSQMNVRLERVNQLLREELSELILRELKDPRLGSMLSITEVDTSPDLGLARVYVSVMAVPEEQSEVLRGLGSATGFLRRALRLRLKLRRIPELRFVLDPSIQQGSELLGRINAVTRSPQAGAE